MSEQSNRTLLPTDVLIQLARLSTPTIYNGWEQITKHDHAKTCFNREPLVDFLPEVGPMVGYAVTVVIEPSNPDHKRDNPTAWRKYREYIASVPGPKIVVVQDLDKPNIYGAFWGEVNSGVHRALGCIGSITDGGVRDLDEMRRLGFKVLAKAPCIGHAYSVPVEWGCPVEVFGQSIAPGQLIHADKHGFLAIPPEDEAGLLGAAQFMDQQECSTVIAATRSAGPNPTDLLNALDSARAVFNAAAKERFSRAGEW